MSALFAWADVERITQGQLGRGTVLCIHNAVLHEPYDENWLRRDTPLKRLS